MNKPTYYILAIAALFLFSQCKTWKMNQSSTAIKGLKDYYKDYFLM
jgi:hypothetical protein